MVRLRRFKYMKKPTSPLQYPLVLRQHLNFMTISVPDLGITLVEDLPPDKLLNKTYVTRIGVRIAEAWLKAQVIMKSKSEANKYLPPASQTKETLKIAEKDLTPMRFSKLTGVSKNTIIRDCKKGIIRSSKTTGGHFKIPVAQVSLYQTYLKQHTRYSIDDWLKETMEKFQEMNEF